MAKERFRQVYFEGLDMLIETIGRRFDQPGYKAYQCLENMLVNAANGIE